MLTIRFTEITSKFTSTFVLFLVDDPGNYPGFVGYASSMDGSNGSSQLQGIRAMADACEEGPPH